MERDGVVGKAVVGLAVLIHRDIEYLYRVRIEVCMGCCSTDTSDISDTEGIPSMPFLFSRMGSSFQEDETGTS